MKITSIKQQVKRQDRYSVFIDEDYAFSLSEQALLDSKLVSGTELTPVQVSEYVKLSADDKIYNQALRYIAIRPRSEWEMKFYLQRKNADLYLIDNILNKLTNIDLLNDETYAKAFIRDRRLLKPSSRRKLQAELMKKRVPQAIIEQVLGNEAEVEQQALREVISRKRRQSKYQDNSVLMQYLARQGFGYSDIKKALSQDDEE